MRARPIHWRWVTPQRQIDTQPIFEYATVAEFDWLDGAY